MKKVVAGCELCSSPAQIYCKSDRAWLCWQCDAKVHGANFLVAKHNRAVLCHHCHAPTPWAASGPRLGPSLSFYLSWLSHLSTLQPTSAQRGLLQAQHQPQEADHDQHDHTNDSVIELTTNDDDSCDKDGDDDGDDDDDQVVPRLTSSKISSCEAEDYNVNSGLLKRKRESLSLYSCSVI